MWPVMLDMTRDECRGILRRLELEAYSNLMTTFRAQGNLNDKKAKILEDLRGMFNISIDRHRAEARRVANDEQLCTVADAVFGPNTTMEWSREGRRPFPVFNRGTAYTSVAAVADKASENATNANANLPYPSETRRPQSVIEIKDDVNIVLNDPVKAAFDEKVNLKRSLPSPNDNANMPLLKKRGEISLNKPNQHIQTTETSAPLEIDDEESNPPTLIPTNSRIQQLYHSHTKLQARNKKITQPKRGKARVSIFEGQDKVEKKIKDKIQTPLKVDSDNENFLLTKIDNELSSPPLPASSTQTITTIDGQVYSPQIATSKKDIATNLTKLNFNTPQSVNVVFTQQPLESQNIVKTQTMITSTPKLIQSTSNISQHTLKMISQPNFKITQNQIIPKGAKMINTNIVETNKLIGSKLSFNTQNQQQKSTVPLTVSPAPKTVVPVLSTSNIISPATLNIDSSVKYSKTSPLHSSVVPNLTIPDLTGKVSHQKLLASVSNVKSTPTTIASNINNPPKVQILNQQIIHSPNHLLKVASTPPIKITAQNNFPMKTIQGKASHIKLIPTSSGMNKVVIKSNATTGNKLAGITQIKSLAPISTTFQVASTNVATTPVQSYQKVQLMPMKSAPGGDAAKSNLIVMQKFNQMTSSTLLRSVKFPKDMNKIILNSRNIMSPSSVQLKSNNITAIQQSTVNSQNNVVVLGISEQKNDKSMNKLVVEKNNLSTVITEDTPVDILTSNSPPNSNAQIILNGSGGLETTNQSRDDGANRFNEKKMTLILNANKEMAETDWEVELDQQNQTERISRSVEIEKRKSSDANNEDAGYDDDEDYDIIEEDCGSVDSEAYASDVIVMESGGDSKNRKYHQDGDDAAKRLYYDLSHNSDNDCIVEDNSIDDDNDQGITNQMTTNTTRTATKKTTTKYNRKSNNSKKSMDVYNAALASSTDDMDIEQLPETTKTIKKKTKTATATTTTAQNHDRTDGNNQIAMDHVEALMIEMHETDERGNRRLGNAMTFNELIASGQVGAEMIDQSNLSGNFNNVSG